MITDLSGFHHLGQRLPVEELLVLHSEYVTAVEEVAKATKGNVQALSGDRVILSWNAVSPVGAHAQQALRLPPPPPVTSTTNSHLPHGSKRCRFRVHVS